MSRSTSSQNGAFATCRWSVSGARRPRCGGGTLRECHRLVDGASERLVGAPATARGSTGFSCRCCSNCSATSRVATNRWTCSQLVELGRSRPSRQLVRRCSRPRSCESSATTRRNSSRRRQHALQAWTYHWTCCHGKTIARWPCCGGVRGTDTAARCKGTGNGSIVAGQPSYGSGWRVDLTVGPYWLLAPNG